MKEEPNINGRLAADRPHQPRLAPTNSFSPAAESKERKGVDSKRKIKHLAHFYIPRVLLHFLFYRQLISLDHSFPLHNFFLWHKGAEAFNIKGSLPTFTTAMAQVTKQLLCIRTTCVRLLAVASRSGCMFTHMS